MNYCMLIVDVYNFNCLFYFKNIMSPSHLQNCMRRDITSAYYLNSREVGLNVVGMSHHMSLDS